MAPIKRENCEYIVDYEFLEIYVRTCEMKSCSMHHKRALEQNAEVSYLVTLKSI